MSDQIENLKPEDVSIGDRPLAIPSELPILPLRDTVLFPNSFMPLAVARESSVRLIDDAIANGKLIAVFTQRDATIEEPTQDDLYPVGTATHIHKMFKLPDGSLRLIVQGLARLKLDEVDCHPALPARPRERCRRGHQRRRPSGDRRAGAQHQDELPAGRLAVAAPVRRSADAGDEHHRARPARRLHRLVALDHQHGGQAGSARDARYPRADGQPEPDPDQRARSPRARLEDSVAGAVRGRQEPARVLPARADEGDSEGARRRRRSDQGDRRARREDRSGRHAGGREEGSAARAGSPVEDAGCGGGVHRLAHLPRLAGRAALERSGPTR